VEKVCLQTAALEDPSLVARIADTFGNQAVVASADVKRSLFGKPKLYGAAAGRAVDVPWLEYLRCMVESGAGEIVLNAVDRDGTMAGMDLEIIAQASQAVSVPIVAIGGAGSLADIKAAVDAGASAVAAGAFFVFHGPHRAVLITYPDYRELESLLGGS
jgi:cyclase